LIFAPAHRYITATSFAARPSTYEQWNGEFEMSRIVDRSTFLADYVFSRTRAAALLALFDCGQSCGLPCSDLHNGEEKKFRNTTVVSTAKSDMSQRHALVAEFIASA
jgi:hypothetical protein